MTPIRPNEVPLLQVEKQTQAPLVLQLLHQIRRWKQPQVLPVLRLPGPINGDNHPPMTMTTTTTVTEVAVVVVQHPR